MTADPGPEFWARQQSQLVVINRIRDMIDEQPDRFTGLVTNGSGHATVYVVDPAATQQPRFVALVDEAGGAGIDLVVTQGVRSSKLLDAIMSEVGAVLAEADVVAVGTGVDVVSGSVEVHVATRWIDRARAVCAARYGPAVTIIEIDRNAFSKLPFHPEPADDWPRPSVPITDQIGRDVGAVAELYRREGFQVQVLDPDRHGGATADLRPNRIRFLVHDGRIVDAAQG
ncbi:hypothetical protein [Pseudonocardia sp. TRM90224]|uniref:hypothetical protein n=1 Tax=Pseudonocardia sp. TRM90224 TaxID=2812678 RepID=UPI001E378AAA|nr:hypothetical protein [Pseudonocardia sp. TRM90224]